MTETDILKTLDPETRIEGEPVPAVTTLLYHVCEGDRARYETACRLIGLFIADARADLKTKVIAAADQARALHASDDKESGKAVKRIFNSGITAAIDAIRKENGL